MSSYRISLCEGHNVCHLVILTLYDLVFHFVTNISLLNICSLSCWDKNPASRPSMDEVVHIMSQLFPFFSGHEEPVRYPSEVSAPVSEGEMSFSLLNQCRSSIDLIEWSGKNMTHWVLIYFTRKKCVEMC
jgi:hypothetical protein